MKKLVAWQEEPVMEAPVINGEMNSSMRHEDMHPDDFEKEESSIEIRRPSKKELDREEGRRGNERKLSNKVTYYSIPGQPDSTPSVPYRPGVARGSYRPTGVRDM